MAFKIYTTGMTRINLRNVKTLELVVSEPSVSRETDKVNHGEVVLNRTRDPRTIEGRIWFESYTASTYKGFLSELRQQLDPLQTYYITDDDEPSKKWLVDISSMAVTRINQNVAEMVIEFYNPKGFCESIGGSLDPLTYQPGVWNHGMGLSPAMNTQSYKHTTSTFMIYNPSAFEIDPSEVYHQLRIKIKALSSGSSIVLTNTTNGQVWRYTGTVNNGDVFLMDNLDVKRNSTNIENSVNLLDANSLITLKKGNNNFTLSGISNFEIEFEFPFLYL